MLREVSWSEDRDYRTGSDYEPVQFYLEALCNSKYFDLLLGYFSSAAINVLSLGFASFLSRGGEMRMIINNVLSQEDKDAIKKGEEGINISDAINISDITELLRTLDEYGKHFFECLAWLIANDRIKIKIIRPKKGKGISHYKSGIFFDGDDYVGFKASCNFTAYGLLENLEELDGFLSWENGRSNKWISCQNKYFGKIFDEKADFVEYLNIDAVIIAIKRSFGDKSLQELVIKEEELIQKKKGVLQNKLVKKTFEKLIIKLNEPAFPYLEGPREYQLEAYQKWSENGYKGIFAMATGTGKTITALNCLLNEYKVNKTYKAIIIVPTTVLLEQWKKECLKFKFKNIITVSSSENWNNSLAFFNTANKFFETSFVVIVTYASLTRPKFQAHFKLLPKETLIIADEVHNMGSPRVLKFLPKIHLNKRIGLSATPNRKFDELGNNSIEAFFNDKPPFVYSYSMKMALDIGWLCKYTYYPHTVYLADDELEDYIAISKQLLKFLDPVTHSYRDNPAVEMLLLARKRIIHKAVNKKGIFKKILQAEFKKRKNLKYTLVYVPEGTDPDYSTTDNYIENEEENRLINEYTRIVAKIDDSIMVKQYTANTTNRNHVIKEFENGDIHVLTSMKCLDEGVDVPRSELAIFCASTGNPRQFIQRRGRVLRIHKDKSHAVIHDLVVVPKINDTENNFEMERNLIKKELERVIDFSELSLNSIDTYEEFREILEYYRINLYDSIAPK